MPRRAKNRLAGRASGYVKCRGKKRRGLCCRHGLMNGNGCRVDARRRYSLPGANEGNELKYRRIMFYETAAREKFWQMLSMKGVRRHAVRFDAGGISGEQLA